MTQNLHRLLWLAMLVTVPLSSGPLAQGPAVSSAQRSYLDLDVRDGAYSEWRVELSPSITALHTTARAVRLGKDAKWRPTFSIFLESGEYEKGPSVGIRLVNHRNQKLLALEIVRWEANQAVNDKADLAVAVGEPVQIDISWTMNSALLHVGSKDYNIPLPGPTKRISVAASTGEFILDPLWLGSTTP